MVFDWLVSWKVRVKEVCLPPFYHGINRKERERRRTVECRYRRIPNIQVIICVTKREHSNSICFGSIVRFSRCGKRVRMYQEIAVPVSWSESNKQLQKKKVNTKGSISHGLRWR
jgi:hypothetical protein